MRIVVLTPSFLPRVGGLEIAIDQLVRKFRELGHDAVVLAQAARTAQAARFTPSYPVTIYPHPLSQRGFYLGARRALVRLHREAPIDVINAQMAYPAGWVATEWARSRKIPVVITCQGGDVSERSRFRTRPMIMARMRRAMAEAALTVAVSAELAEAAKHLAGGRDVDVIPNGVDLGVAEPATAPGGATWVAQLDSQPFLLYMKRLHAEKGHALLLESYAQACRRESVPPLLVFAGAGREEAALRARALGLGLEKRLIMVGEVAGGAKRWLLQQCAAFIHPSGREGMPLVVLEAMACGRPVVAVRAEGLSTLVEEGKTGLLVSPDDPGALAHALVSLFRDHDPARMAAAARERAGDFAWDSIAQTYLARFAALREHLRKL